MFSPSQVRGGLVVGGAEADSITDEQLLIPHGDGGHLLPSPHDEQVSSHSRAVSFRNYKNVEDPRGLWVRVGEKRRCALREARYEMSGGCGVPLRKGTARGCTRRLGAEEGRTL